MVDRGSFSNFMNDLTHVDGRVRSNAPLDKNTPLPEKWIPDKWSVICGRGRECFDHCKLVVILYIRIVFVIRFRYCNVTHAKPTHERHALFCFRFSGHTVYDLRQLYRWEPSISYLSRIKFEGIYCSENENGKNCNCNEDIRHYTRWFQSWWVCETGTCFRRVCAMLGEP